jgi:hypothetical protein
MPKSYLRLAVITAVALLSRAAVAQDDIVSARGWAQFDTARDGDCSAEVRGNGKIFRISGSGFAPDAAVFFHLENEDIVPLDYEAAADGDGRWSRYYMPFLWHHDGGTVDVLVSAGQCTMRLSFPWTLDDPNRTL